MNMRWRLNSCRERRESVSLLASGALPEAEQTSVRDHLAHCAQCRQHYDEIARLSAQFQKWASTEPPVEVGPAFHARWTRSIQAADAPAQGRQVLRSAGNVVQVAHDRNRREYWVSCRAERMASMGVKD